MKIVGQKRDEEQGYLGAPSRDPEGSGITPPRLKRFEGNREHGRGVEAEGEMVRQRPGGPIYIDRGGVKQQRARPRTKRFSNGACLFGFSDQAKQ